MDSSSFSTSESIHSLTQSEQFYEQNQTLPLTSSNLEILQMTNQIHAKHHFIAAYVQNQIAILALEAKLQHQRWKEMQTLVPLETAPFEKETIICCTDRKYDDADGETNIPAIQKKTKDKKSGILISTPPITKETPGIKKRHSWMFTKQQQQHQQPRRNHSQHHSVSHLSTNSAHHQQRYNQEKLDLIKQGLCGSSSSCLVASPYPSSFIEDHPYYNNQPNQLASLLFSSLVSSCTSSNSSSFSFLNVLKESAARESHSLLSADQIRRDPPRPASLISSSSLSSKVAAAVDTKSSKVSSWWKRHLGQKTPHQDHADFIAFRYPKMISFHKLRDTALQLLLSSDASDPNNHLIIQEKCSLHPPS